MIYFLKKNWGSCLIITFALCIGLYITSISNNNNGSTMFGGPVTQTYQQVQVIGTKQFVRCGTNEYPIDAQSYANLATSPIPQINGEKCVSAYQRPAYSTVSGDLEINDYYDAGNQWYANVNGVFGYYDKTSSSFDITMNQQFVLSSSTSSLQ